MIRSSSFPVNTNRKESSTTNAENEKDPRIARLERANQSRRRRRSSLFTSDERKDESDRGELYNYGRALLNLDLADFGIDESAYGGGTTLRSDTLNANVIADMTQSLALDNGDVCDNEQGTTTTPRNELLRHSGVQPAIQTSNVTLKHEDMLPVHPNTGTAPEQKHSRQDIGAVNVTKMASVVLYIYYSVAFNKR